MSEDALEKLLDELHKNGVYAEVGEVSKQKYERLKIVLKTDIKLDFSEHDKVFEDKIASLEKRMAYMKGKNNYLRTRCMEDAIDAFDRGSYGALTIVGRRVDLEVENEKLKQRIAELESRETKKPINGWICVVAKEINGQEYVKLEDFMRVVNDLQEQNRFEDDGK
jgi:hypothetical protein